MLKHVAAIVVSFSILGFFGSVPVQAFDVSLCIGVPSKLGGTNFMPNQTAYSAPGGYSVGIDLSSLGDAFHLDALAPLSNGGMLFSPDAPFTAGGERYSPADIVQYLSGSFSLYLAGGSGGLGLTDASNIDAIAFDRNGNLLVSFDAPTTVGSTTFQPADIAVVVRGVISSTPVFVGSSAGIPDWADTIGVEQSDDGDLFLAFDVPVAPAGTTFLPGMIVRYDAGTGMTLFWSDPLFPTEGSITDFAFRVSPGSIPNGSTVPGTPFTVAKAPGTNLALSWGASCTSGVSTADYAVYEGVVGTWTSHVPVAGWCTTASAMAATITPASGDRYYLVVPRNPDFEGSYGTNSSGVARPQSLAPCIAIQMARSCP